MNNMMSMLLIGGLAFVGWQMFTRTRNQQALVEAPQAAQQRPDNPPASLFWRNNNQLPEDVDTDIGI